MKNYLELLDKVIAEGIPSENRTGVPTVQLFGEKLEYYMEEGFPAVTTKKLQWKSVVLELLWFLRGETNTGSLGCGIWDEWATEVGELGPIYGSQWRNFHGIDQLGRAIKLLKENPSSRRIIVDSWNPEVLPIDGLTPQQNASIGRMALAPCHMMFQFHVDRIDEFDTRLSIAVYQRSCDIMLGLPFNIASYALLLHIVAKEVDMTPHKLVWMGGNVHLYENHLDGANEQLKRIYHRLPKLGYFERKPMEEYTVDDFKLERYIHDNPIKLPIAV